MRLLVQSLPASRFPETLIPNFLISQQPYGHPAAENSEAGRSPDGDSPFMVHYNEQNGWRLSSPPCEGWGFQPFSG